MTMQQRRTIGSSNNGGRMNYSSQQQRPTIKKKIKRKNTMNNDLFLDPDWETNLQFCMVMTLLLMSGFYAVWKLSGGGGGIPLKNMKLTGGENNPYYLSPLSMKDIGDKSPEYASLRSEIDAILTEDHDRSQSVVKSLHKHTYQTIPIPDDNVALHYDIYNCPDEPPLGYPYAWPILEVLTNWSPDDPTPPLNEDTGLPHVYQGLCVFDFLTDYDKALTYRTMELPFVIKNDPAVAATVERWNYPNYMNRLMNTVPHRTEYSVNNHFMYWTKPNSTPKDAAAKRARQKAKEEKLKKEGKLNPKRGFHNGGGYHVEKPANWSQPTQMMRMTYEEWLGHANVSDDQLGPDKPHWYYRLIGCGTMGNGKCDKGSSEYLFDELTFFQPKDGLYLTEPSKQKGIHCRFGMKGVIAENHFDGSRNAIVVLGGERRYILSHPNQCELLALYPKEHPSARHSAVDWSDPDLESFPDFHKAVTNEVVLQAGDVLYLPTNWFHYIISLDLNYQCNTRSGITTDYMPPIHDCGF